jgi:two-component system NarL family sensor kinase
MKRTLYIALLLTIGFRVYCVNIDSLKRVLKNVPQSKKNSIGDTTECDLLFQLSANTVGNESEAYFEQLKSVAEKKLNELPSDSPLRRIFKRHMSIAYNDLALMHRERGDIVKALEYLHLGLKIDEEINPEELGVNYNNLALVYYSIGDKDKALEYFKKSLACVEKINDKWGITHCLINLGSLYYKCDDHIKAMDCYEKSLKLAREIGSGAIEAKALDQIGILLDKKGMHKQAMEYHLKSLALNKELGHKTGTAVCMCSIGNCLKLQGNYSEALVYASKSLEMLLDLKSVESIRVAAHLLKEIHEALGNDREALKMYDLYVQMRDSTNNENTRKAGLKKQFEYEYEKKELLLKEEQERMKKLFEQKRKFYVALTCVLVLLVIIVFISFYFRYRFKKEKESKDLHIELKEQLKQEITEKENIANSLIHIQEKEREKLAAELHDGVNQLLFAAKIQLQASTSVEEEMHRNAVTLVESAINEIKSIANNQSSFLLNDKSLKDALNDLILQMKGHKDLKITFLNYGLDESTLNQNQKTNILRIIQELLNNVIRHSNAKNCYLSIKTIRNTIMFAVTDNGTGFNFKTAKNGNGLRNIGNKVRLMNGIKKTFSIHNAGSKIHIEIPIS